MEIFVLHGSSFSNVVIIAPTLQPKVTTMVKSLVVADSVLILDDKDDATWLESVDVVVSVQRGRRFRKHSWVPECVHSGQRFDHIAVLCAANDAIKGGPRTKSHLDDVILTRLQQDLGTLNEYSDNVSFVLMGDWSLWRDGFADTGKETQAQFEHCLQQMEEAARRVPGVRVQHVIRPLYGLPMTSDKWHFTRGAGPTLRRVIFEEIFCDVGEGDESSESSDRLHIEEDVALDDGHDDDGLGNDMEPFRKHRKLEHLIERNVDVVDFDAGRRIRMEQLLTDSSSLTTLASLLPDGMSFPENQTDIPNGKYHDMFFFKTLAASKGKNAKTSLSGWRRWFGDNPQAWLALKKAIDSNESEIEPSCINHQFEDSFQSKAPAADFDAGRRCRMEQLLTESSSLALLASLLPGSMPFPEVQADLPNDEYHDMFFFDTLGASKGRNPKTSISGWRRWFSDNPQAWLTLKKAVCACMPV